MSEAFLGLSVHPYAKDEVKRENKTKTRTMWKTQSGFKTILKKDKISTYMYPKQLHPTQIEDLKQNIYHERKARADAILKPTRGMPLRGNRKPDFARVAHGTKFFSLPEVKAG